MKNQEILDYNIIDYNKPPVNILVLFFSLIILGIFIGATTGLLNGIICREFYATEVFALENNLLLKAILLGMLDGLIYGTIYGIIYTIRFAAITKQKADWIFIKSQLKLIMILIYSCWLIGGIVGIYLGADNPSFNDSLIHTSFSTEGVKLRFSWVTGAIQGAIIGGFLALIASLYSTKRNWHLENE